MLELSGKQFGRLTVIRFHEVRPGRRYHWWCRCQCGKEKSINRQYLVNGKTVSCGCVRDARALETMAANPAAFTGARLEHGLTDTPTWRSWAAMIQRCTNSRRSNYKFYGGRGIAVCSRWLEFKNFYEDMGARPDDMTLDRWPNNDGNYEPGNVRWATPRAQSNNRRKRSA